MPENEDQQCQQGRLEDSARVCKWRARHTFHGSDSSGEGGVSQTGSWMTDLDHKG